MFHLNTQNFCKVLDINYKTINNYYKLISITNSFYYKRTKYIFLNKSIEVKLKKTINIKTFQI